MAHFGTVQLINSLIRCQVWDCTMREGNTMQWLLIHYCGISSTNLIGKRCRSYHNTSSSRTGMWLTLQNSNNWAISIIFQISPINFIVSSVRTTPTSMNTLKELRSKAWRDPTEKVRGCWVKFWELHRNFLASGTSLKTMTHCQSLVIFSSQLMKIRLPSSKMMWLIR